jgi:mono/diheme cytochrome c family protein
MERKQMILSRIILAALMTLWCGAGAFAQAGPGDPVAGYLLATESCAECHVVSDKAVPSFVFDVPSFFAIANNPAVTAISISVFLRTPHASMPNLILKTEDIDNVATYILSLRGLPVPPPYVLQPME